MMNQQITRKAMYSALSSMYAWQLDWIVGVTNGELHISRDTATKKEMADAILSYFTKVPENLTDVESDSEATDLPAEGRAEERGLQRLYNVAYQVAILDVKGNSEEY